MNIIQGPAAKVRRFNIPLKLTPAQQTIEAGFKRFNFIRAGRKFGKTKYSEKKALDWLSPPNSCHWHIAPTYKQAKLISWDSFKRLIPQEALYKKPNDNELSMQLKNGSQLLLMGSDEPDSLRGPAPTSVTFEEAAFHKAEAWHDVIRPNLTVHRAPALFISSPNGFNWFKDLEDEALARIEAGDDEWAVFHFSIYDNPYIDREEIDKIKAQCDPRVWSQEYMAEYESSVGRVFHDFQDTKRHVDYFPMPQKHEECHRSIDWGMRDDTATLWGFIRGNRVHIYRENAENGLPPAGQAQIVLARTPAHENIVGNIIGHDASRTDTEMKGLTIQWHFSNAGIRPLRVGGRKKDANRAMIQQLLAQDRIVIHPECRKLRKQLLSYSWKDTAMEKTEDGGDDLVDSLHSMVELLQYKLFLRPWEEKTMTMEEIYAHIRAEKAAQMVRRYPMQSEEESNVPNFDGSHAGYL
jgi:hypothetical protein